MPPRKKSTRKKTPLIDYISPGLQPLAMDIDDIALDQHNVRDHDEKNSDAIQRSLQAFGQQKPIVLLEDGTVIAGNGTVTAARALGWTHIAAVKTQLTGNQAKAFAIADNRTSDLSEFNQQALAQQLSDLQQDIDIDALTTGFDDDEIKKLIDEAANIVGDFDDDEPEPKEKEIPENFGVLITCKDEHQQQAVYEQMTDKGFACKVLTM